MPYGILPEDPNITRANIERYRQMLANGINDPTQRAMIERLLHSAERLLQRPSAKPE